MQKLLDIILRISLETLAAIGVFFVAVGTMILMFVRSQIKVEWL